MADEPTCGTGMAANAVLPTRIAEVAAALADMLSQHCESLDPDEPAAAAERDAWLAIAADHRQLAGGFATAADRMEAQHDLPAANHDMSQLTSEVGLSAFEHFVAAQERLNDLLTEQLDQYRTMLAQARGETEA